MNVEQLIFQPGIAKLNVSGENVKPKMVNGQSFDSVLGSFMDMINETNAYQIQAEQIQVDYAAGRTDDMLAVMLSQEKAYASLNFTVQVTNKLLEAYREIMRIPM